MIKRTIMNHLNNEGGWVFLGGPSFIVVVVVLMIGLGISLGKAFYYIAMVAAPPLLIIGIYDAIKEKDKFSFKVFLFMGFMVILSNLIFN